MNPSKEVWKPKFGQPYLSGNYIIIRGCTVDSRYKKNPWAQLNYFVISKFCYNRVAKTIKYKEILNFGTKKITLLYQDFVISVFFITRVL